MYFLYYYYMYLISGNALSAYILAGKSMRNSFNLLLIALAMIDNTYLFCSIVESCRKRFDLQTDLHLILLPYFLYPLHSMAMTGSILMTVAIALERYNAVHWPISYSQVRKKNTFCWKIFLFLGMSMWKNRSK